MLRKLKNHTVNAKQGTHKQRNVGVGLTCVCDTFVSKNSRRRTEERYKTHENVPSATKRERNASLSSMHQAKNAIKEKHQ
jgi:hypothetical protein